MRDIQWEATCKSDETVTGNEDKVRGPVVRFFPVVKKPERVTG